MNTAIRIFKYRFLVKEIVIVFFCYLLMENIFSWLFIQNSLVIEMFEKLLSIGIYIFMLYKFPSLKPVEKFCIGLFTLLLIRMVFESLREYNTFFQEFTMYTILFPVVFALFIKYICRVYDLDLLEFIANFYIFTYIIFMIIYGRQFSFSLAEIKMVDYGPFSGDTRIIHADSVLMMIIPFLFYLNKFIKTKKNKFLIPFIFCTLVIIVHQHRSVWSSTAVALMAYLFATVRIQKKVLSPLFKLIVGGAFLLVIVYIYIVNLNPHFLSFLSERFGEIFNPSKEGSTGNFRIEQRETYFKLFLQHPFFGWTFKGFEMPNPLVDWWPPMTGQHFHEGYMEMLFYEGVTGFLFKYSFLLYLCIKIFSKKLSEQSIMLCAFSISGLLFSFNYVLPIIFWGHVGLCLFYLEKDSLQAKFKFQF